MIAYLKWGLILLAAWLPLNTSAGQLPAPIWSTETSLESEDGYADLSWGVPGSQSVSFFRLTEQFGDTASVHFLDHPTTRLFRGEPGTYQFQVQACERGFGGYPQCGEASDSLALTVSSAVGERQTGKPEGKRLPPPVTRSPSDLTPGRWHNPARDGHGWSFYWKNGLGYGPGNPNYGNAWDLVGIWYTYEARVRYEQDPENCPGASCVWVYEEYQPIYAQLAFTSISANQAQGTVYITRSGVTTNVGAVQVDFLSADAAEVTWNADFLYQNLQSSDTLEMLVAPDSDPVDNPAHYSGIWQPGGGQNYAVVSALGWISESVELLFDDDDGNPTWIIAEGDLPQVGPTDLCFYYVDEGFAPDTTGNWAMYTDGCQPDLDSPQGSNGWRAFTDFEEQQFWVQMDLPGGYAPQGISLGSAASPHVLEKEYGLHRIWYQSDAGSGCDLDGPPGDCTANLTWFSDGNFPDITVYALETNTGAREFVTSAEVGEDFAWTATSPGLYQFELRMADTTDAALMAVSQTFLVTGQGGGGSPETPPGPAPMPSMSPTVASSSAGATNGAFAVSPLGSATYQVPILTAPGSGGLAPALSLAYDSQAGNGPLGVGWNINGFSIISRCAQTIEQDGVPQLQRITFTTLDRFCMDGERLMAISGAYGAHGTEYRKEHDDYTRVISYGGGANGPAYFIATTREGMMREFGRTTDSHIKSRVPGMANAVYAWAQNRLEDTAGNYVDYEYSVNTQGPVDFVLDKVRYTGNQAAGVQPFAEIRFNYSASRSDAPPVYIAGVAATHSRLLESVDSRAAVASGQAMQSLRHYRLDYGVDGFGRAVIESLEECRDASASVCFEPTTMDWHKSEHEVSSNGPNVSSLFTSDFAGIALGDISGDGRADLLITERDGHQYEFGIATGSSGGSFSMGSQKFSLPDDDFGEGPAAVAVIDLNADGYQDVMYARRDITRVDWYARLSGPNGLGSEFMIVEDCCDILAPGLLQVMDFNGDGLSDVLTHRPLPQSEHASELVVLINQFQPGDALPHFADPEPIGVNYPALFPSQTPSGWRIADEYPGFGFQTPRDIPGRVEDFYGDGTTDILVRLSRYYSRCIYDPCRPDGPGPGGEIEPDKGSGFVIPFGGNSRSQGPTPDPGEEFGIATFYLAFFADQNGAYSTYQIVAKGAGEDCDVSEVCSLHNGIPEVKRTLPADINADGLSDVVYIDANDAWYYRVNTGAGFQGQTLIGVPSDEERSNLGRLGDINGDGYPDFMYPSQAGSDSATWKVHYNDFGQAFSAGSTTAMPAGNTNQGDFSIMLDFTGDGIRDQLFVDWRANGSGAEPTTTRLRRGINGLTGQTGQAVNLVKRFENGFGARTDVSYLPLTDPQVHTRLRNSANADWGRGSVVYDLQAPFQVVSSVKQSAPTQASPNTMAEVEFHYLGARLQAGGRGFLGFAEVISWDPNTALRSHTRYRQDFPFSGQIADMATYFTSSQHKFDLITDISQVSPMEWPSVGPMSSLDAGLVDGELIRYKIYELNSVENGNQSGAWAVQTVAELAREHGLDGQFKSKEYTTRTYDTFGNIRLGTKRSYATDNTSAWSTVASDNTWINNTSDWRLGRLASTEVDHWRADTGNTISRSSSYAYHPQNDLLVRETAEPGHPSLQVVTAYTLDGFGNRVATTVTGTGMAPRTSYADFDADGRFVIQTRNAYGQVTMLVDEWDAFGSPLEVYNIDGVFTINAVDHMGRSFASYAESGAQSRTAMGMGAHGQCPSGTASHSVTSGLGSAAMVECFDKLGRSIRKATEGFLGSWVYIDNYFDRSGRPEKVSEPYFAGQARYWNTTEYDPLGRITRVTSANNLVEDLFYDSAASHCGQQGLRAVLTVTNPGDGTTRRHWERKNAAGETERVIDNNCGVISHHYDSVGNLVQTTGIDGAVISIAYDPLGMQKVQLSDPDKGLWQYASNALGEVTRQLDSKQQAIDFDYDLLGRVTNRRELTGVSSLNDTSYQVENHEIRHWQNSTTPGVTGRGQLDWEEYRTGGSGAVLHRRDYVYDDLGRIQRVDHTLEGETFADRTTYDEVGRVFQQFDASGNNHGVRFHYNNRGYVTGLQEAREGSNGVFYQQVLAMDARGNTTAAELGNQVEVFADYDPVSGYVQRLEAYEPSGAQIQFVDYDFDRLGNLLWRHDSSGANNLREDFEYDLLNRVERVFLTAPALGANMLQTLSQSYSAAGNIAYKSDVGGYSYGQSGAGPHAVTQAGQVSYAYDANGNQVSSSDGRSIDYSVFDKATRIQKGSSFTEFSYGLGNRRYKRVDSNTVDGQKTTWTVGSIEYIEAAGAADLVKRYIAGIAIADYRPDSGNEDAWYLVKDHLGSIHSISDDNGVKTQEQHYNPWGLRQQSDWQSPLQGGALQAANASTTRGFTGHEHADGLGIIHMNGRIYDPKLGRFLQADPFVQAPRNGQSLNRYSYALNNPLSYTDPSGYFIKRLIRKWGKAIVAAVVSYLTYGAASGWAAGFLSQSAAAAVGAGAASFVGVVIQTGNVKGALRGAFKSTVLAYVGHQVRVGYKQWKSGKADVYDVIYDESKNKWVPETIAGKTHPELTNLSVNGMKNNLESAANLTAEQLYGIDPANYVGKSFQLFHNPTHGLIADSIESLLGKLTNTSSLSRQLAGLLENNPATLLSINAHSQGTIIVSNAMRMLEKGVLPEGVQITFNGAAVSERLMRRVAKGIGLENVNYRARMFDFVSNVIGMTTLNPFKILGSTLLFPTLFMGRKLSQHSVYTP